MIRKLGGYLLNLVVSAGVSFLSIPVVIAHAGAGPWSGVAVGQTIGVIGAVFVGWGWNVVGPAAVAALPAERRLPYFDDSFTARLALFVAALLPVALSCAIFTPAQTSWLVCTVSALQMITAALGGNWFFVGTGRPRTLLFLDTLPRSLGTLVGMVVLAGLHASLIWFPVCQLAGGATAVLLARVTILRGHRPDPGRLRSALRAIRANASGLGAAAGSHVLVYSPVLVVSALAPTQLPAYAVADRLMKFTAVSMAPLTQVAQGYVPDPDRSVRRRRIRLTLGWMAAIAPLIAAAFTIALPIAVRLLSSHHLHLDHAVALGLGLALACLVLTNVIGLACLVAEGASNALARTMLVTSLFVVPACAVGVEADGLVGASVAVAAVQLGAVVGLLFTLRRRLQLP